MRTFLTLTMLACLAPIVAAGPSEEAKEIDRLEKAGAEVTIGDRMPDEARLRVRFARLDDKGATALRGCKHVGALTVEDASKLHDRSLAIIGALHGLRELSLFDPAISNAGVGHLRNLKELRKLYLIDARVYDSGVAYLKGLDALEELDLSGTAITNASGATFKDLPELKLLAVSKTKFGDTGVAQLHELKNLKKLEAVNTNVSVKAAMGLEAAIPRVRVRR